MKRDWDLIRLILTSAESKAPGEKLNVDDITGYSANIVTGHFKLLNDAGFVEARIMRTGMFSEADANILNITFIGYDLLETIRTRTVWEKIKTTAKDKGMELTFEVVKLLGTEAVKSLLAQP